MWSQKTCGSKPKLLAQFPTFKTLRPMHTHPNHSTHLLSIFPALTQLTLAFRHLPACDFGLPAILRLACAFPLLECLQSRRKQSTTC
jgi:hypothetical protein